MIAAHKTQQELAEFLQVVGGVARADRGQDRERDATAGADDQGDGERTMTPWQLWLFALFLLPVITLAHGQTASSAPNAQERWEQAIRLSDILEALAISSGSHVADIGAGEGFFTARLAKKVGPEGRIFAIDVDEKYAIPKLQELVQKQSLENVAVIHSVPDDPKLSTRSIDAVLMVIVYHEVEPHREMLGHVLDALKLGEPVVIVDNMPHKTRITVSCRPDQESRSQSRSGRARTQGCRLRGCLSKG
jgi:predicted O-methyltransferase YrrM